MKITLYVSIIFFAALAMSIVFKTRENINDSTNKMMLTPPFKEVEFLWAGRLLSDPALLGSDGELILPAKKHADSLIKFPDVHGCLAISEKEKTSLEDIDVLRFDWRAISSQSDFHVCTFHVGNAIADNEKFAEWFMLSGFKAQTGQSSIDTAGSFVSVAWDSSINGALYPYPRPLLIEWVERIFSRNTAFAASIDLNGKQEVTSISSGISYE